ncbi:patatin-like phospholipase family protein [Rhizobium sp. L1K21]|uniref:patatin-like phospholipase family protein n=1 Tax=Rhizobium sp. L1K21 TaxID=2954933 RepID=UPI002093A175|nr:patatin-like phospholipase family protein [Rhizobium sp. L1K21]MCO6187898.1 patatin-like phospholipase family protein [Rhizobium sp. L1K21]
MEECDLVMKGGITSGVVYPHAVAKVAGRYRLRNIGGTSAGAIAAVMAAAAEYRRQQSADKMSMDGFTDIQDLAGDLASELGTFFQPVPELKPIYDLMIAALEAKGNKLTALVRASFSVFRGSWLVGGIVALVGVVAGILICSAWLAVLGLVVGLLVAAGLIGAKLYQLLNVELPEKNNFGLCPGTQQPGFSKPALTDWMAEKIDSIAGLTSGGKPAERPLTVGDLKAHGITIAAMTTDLSSGRPYQLPFQTEIHYFSKCEFEKLLPKRVVDYLAREENRRPFSGYGLPDDLYKLPVGDEMPVLLVARMSLSFPALIQAVPLYRFDDEIKGKDGVIDKSYKIRKCVFSDGGISSNFPIHFFDAFLPGRPTLGITLAEYSVERHGDKFVDLPEKARADSRALAVRPPKGILGFLMSIVNTAKDWQDTLQTKLPGYAERIVEIRLNDKEGGMNLNMDDKTVQRLVDLGKEAGEKLVEDFNFNEHRWRRVLSFMTVMEDELIALSRNYDKSAPGGKFADMQLPEILTAYVPTAYASNTKTWRKNELKPFVEKLVEMGREAETARNEKRGIQNGKAVPKADARIRLIADADRVPQSSSNSD